MMRLHNGDCLNVLKMMIEDEVFVDSIVTDPPYELGFMGRSWDSTGIAFQKETWELCFKVLKPGGHLLAFSGSRTYHRMAVAIEDAGFEIRDQVMWLYGSGFPKSMNIGKALDKKLGNERIKTGEKKTHSNKGIKQSEQRTAIGAGAFGQEVEEDLTVGTTEWEGWGTALKPAHEPLVLARKPISENSVVDNVLKHRTGGINIDDCRVEGNDAKYPDSNPVMNSGKYAQNENAKRKMVVRKTRTDDSVFNNGNSSFRAEGTLYADADPRGRFPSNVMHDGSDVVKDIFPKTGTKGKAKYPDSNPDFRDQGRQSKENMGIDKLSFGQTENVKRKKVVRKSRDENGVWTNDNSGMKAEGSEYADADPRGRFPSNVMHDGSDVVKDIFPNTKSSNVSRERKAGTEFGQSSGWNKHNNVDSGLMPAYGDEGSASRYFYCAKTSKAERNQGLDNFPIKQTQGGGGGIGNYKDDVNSASGKFGSEKAPSKNTHPTVKPIKLMKYLCRLITPKGGTVLDPFMGSGSTGIAAKDEGFEFIGIEKEKEYFEIAERRISVASPLEECMK